MAKIFISYSRVDTLFMKAFVAALREMFTDHSVWVDEELTGGDDWWAEICTAIGEADIFIYLLSNESVTSEYCQAEFEEAQRLRKRIISVQVRDRTTVPENLNHIQYVDMKNGVQDADAQRRLVRAINKQVKLIPARRPKAAWTPITPKPAIKKEPERPVNTPDKDTPDLKLIPVEPQTPTGASAKWSSCRVRRGCLGYW